MACIGILGAEGRLRKDLTDAESLQSRCKGLLGHPVQKGIVP